jgi:hypothetical protein
LQKYATLFKITARKNCTRHAESLQGVDSAKEMAEGEVLERIIADLPESDSDDSESGDNLY